MAHEIRVYHRNRDIPWKDTHIRLVPGQPVTIDDEEMVDHIRKFHNPVEHRAISIREILEPKSVRSMNLVELREHADSIDVEYADSDSRNDIMKRMKVKKNVKVRSNNSIEHVG